MSRQPTDQDALQALLASVEDRERAKKQERREYAERERSKRPRYDKKPRSLPSSQRGEDNYYGPASNEEKEPVEKQKANFGLSGALTKDAKSGNTYKGVVLKFQEPPDARAPNTHWRLYVFKGDEQVDLLHISQQSAYLIGRNEEIADIPLAHASCSGQHAVLQYRAVPTKDGDKRHCQPYLMDLESTHGTFLNGTPLESARYYQLHKGDVLKFGASTREYVLLTADSTSLK